MISDVQTFAFNSQWMLRTAKWSMMSAALCTPGLCWPDMAKCQATQKSKVIGNWTPKLLSSHSESGQQSPGTQSAVDTFLCSAPRTWWAHRCRVTCMQSCHPQLEISLRAPYAQRLKMGTQAALWFEPMTSTVEPQALPLDVWQRCASLPIGSSRLAPRTVTLAHMAYLQEWQHACALTHAC